MQYMTDLASDKHLAQKCAHFLFKLFWRQMHVQLTKSTNTKFRSLVIP
jgi:hypothetical protein